MKSQIFMRIFFVKLESELPYIAKYVFCAYISAHFTILAYAFFSTPLTVVVHFAHRDIDVNGCGLWIMVIYFSKVIVVL